MACLLFSMSELGESSELDFPAFTDCEERSLKVIDIEADRAKKHFEGLVEQTKKERDKKVQECGGYNKYKKLIDDMKEDPDLQYTPTEINIEVTRREILQVEITDMKEIIQGLETKENYYRGLVGRPYLSPYSKEVYTRKFKVASRLRRASKARLDRRKKILKEKVEDLI